MTPREPREHCSVCDEELSEDDLYGDDDFPLCRYHHKLFNDTVYAMIELSEPQQMSLFADAEALNNDPAPEGGK